MPLAYRKLVSCLILGTWLTAAAAHADVVPVVSTKNPVDGLSKNQVADIFLGKLRRFPTGNVAIPIDQMDGSDIRNAFYMQFANRNAEQIKMYWAKLIFTGRGLPPREVFPSDKVKEALAENPNRIGYIKRSELDPSVKIVSLGE